ncbi:MAG: DUF2510 domain-containing protein [Actinomycetales bacterium]|nr:DUF2510 domain-containing protein [Actinomycetales bacterium]
MADLDVTGTRDDTVRVDFGTADQRLVDATGGRLDLPASSLDVTSLTLVSLTRPPTEVARLLGLVERGGFTHGARWGVLEPADGHWRAAILTVGEPAPAHSRIEVGRLSDRAVARWAPALDGRAFRVVVFVEATPGFAGIEVRFLRGVVEGAVAPAGTRVAPTRAELDLLLPPPVPEGWYVDPSGTSLHRWWDGIGWTPHTSPS